MTQDWKEDLARENYTDKWLILLIEKLLAEERNAVLEDLETMLDDAIFHCNATGPSGESVMAYQSAKTLVNNLRVK